MNEANVDRFRGIGRHYDAVRPRAPGALVDLLCQLARTPRPRRVVDLGSGTGLSTFLWVGRADEIVGIEPNSEMRAVAESRSQPGVRFHAGEAASTGLPDGSVDIVTCAQSLHWMEPEPTFAEAARILRSGGVFAAYDNDWPPACHWEAEAAYDACMARAEALEAGLATSSAPVPGARHIAQGAVRWAKEEHLARMRASGRFRYVREVCLHHVEEGNAARFVGVLTSQGGVAKLLKSGVGEKELGLDVLKRVSERVLGGGPTSFYWTYRVRLGVR